VQQNTLFNASVVFSPLTVECPCLAFFPSLQVRPSNIHLFSGPRFAPLLEPSEGESSLPLNVISIEFKIRITEAVAIKMNFLSERGACDAVFEAIKNVQFAKALARAINGHAINRWMNIFEEFFRTILIIYVLSVS
jgi:hypothetical protein